jgi:hypothetical protein
MAAMVALLAAPFVTRGESCPTSEEQSLVESVRGLIDDVKAKLGWAASRRSPVMGKMMYVPPSGAP